MQTSQIKDLNDIVHLALGTKALWWRGQPRPDPLVPGVFRDPQINERNLTLQFRSRAPMRHPKCPAHDDLPAWLFFMQHYRLRTRLLDWTESVLFAAFYAVETDPESSGVLWGIDPIELNVNQFAKRHILIPESKETLPMFQSAFKEAPYSEKIAAVGVREIDIRMMVQQSAFTIHDTRQPMDFLPENVLVRRAEIPGTAKERIRHQLSRVGVRRRHLFPDLETLATELQGEA